MGEETVWLTQDQMAALFDRDKSVISRHLKNIFEECELNENSVVARFATTAADGKSYDTNYYNLDVIISVGYRVKSHQGTQFRIWATQVLREYLIKGFALNDERMKSGKSMNYFDELQERIREMVLDSITPEEILSRLTPEQKQQVVQAILADVTPEQMMAMLTEDQRVQLMADVVKGLSDEQRQQLAQQLGVQVDPAQILAAMTPDQRDAMAREFMASDAGKALMGQYLGSIDKDALLAEYMKTVDTDALMRQYMESMDTSTLVAQYLQGVDTEALMEQYLSSLTPEQLAEMAGMTAPTQEQIDALMARYSGDTPRTYDDVLVKLGYATEDRPERIVIYPRDFEAKRGVEDFIAGYNAQAKTDADKVTYNDLVGMMTSSITDIINMITMALLAFVAISLVVSSIMIAIITYISVLERTKEIGVLRAIGSSKGDVTRIFTAETFIEGLLAGLIGVAVVVLIDIPICIVVEQDYGVAGIAVLPPVDGLMLVAISVALTLAAGFIPSRMAARKDPVEALRSE